MNCLEYRRALSAEPRRESAVMLQHRQECARCADFHARTLGFESSLRRALAVPAPEGLAERILLAHATRERRDGGSLRRRASLALAAAASVLLAVAAGVTWWRNVTALPYVMVDHLAHEPGAFASQAPLPAANVEKEFAFRGVALAGPVPAGVSYVAPCPIGPYKSVHMVMPVDNEAVTVIYLANHHVDARDDFVEGSWRGRSVPAGKGTLVLLATSPRSFDAVEGAWRNTLEGSVNSATGGR
jgi:hypothetical protein